MNLIALILAFAGFTALALGMHRHYRQLRHRALRSTTQILLRVLGAALLTASFAASIADAGWAIGPVLWLGWLTAAALTVALLLTWWPPQAKRTS
jgi:purine-cytosine permease-like protein